jgi:uncharacterized protein (UPF0303 family)
VTELTRSRVAEIEREVAQHAFAVFDQKHALDLGRLLLATSESQGLRIGFGIDLGDQVMFRAALPGTNADYQFWIDRKFAAVRRFGKASMHLELLAELEPEFARERALDPSRYALCGGAVPLLVGPCVIGVIGCAGLSSIEDHRHIIRTLAIYRKTIGAC